MITASPGALLTRDRVQFLSVVLLSGALAFNLTEVYIFLALVAVLSGFQRRFQKDQAVVLKQAAAIAGIFVVYFAWSIPVVISTGSLSPIERTLPFLFFPFMIALTRIDRERFRLIFQSYVLAIVLSYLITLSAAVANYLYEPPQWGRASDFFFHVQLSNAAFGMHPTYYGLMGCLATFFTFSFFRKAYKYLIILFLTIFIFLLDARITIAVQCSIVIFFLAALCYKKSKILSIVAVLSLVALLGIGLRLINSVYDYPHRSLAIDLDASWRRSFAQDISDADGGVIPRLAIWRNAVEVIRENPWFGVGNGMEVPVLLEHYTKNDVPFLILKQYNAHNQFLSFLITFGIVGTALIAVYFIWFLARAFAGRKWLYLWFVLIVVIACLTESILYRLQGVSLFVFFNSLFLLKYVNNEEE